MFHHSIVVRTAQNASHQLLVLVRGGCLPGILLGCLSLVCPGPKAGAAPVITEIMAENQTVLVDQDGEFSDWIEIHNPDGVPVSLKGWALTDDPARVKRWVFPDTTLPAGGRLVVFASGKNYTTPGKSLHTDFRLNAEGEYLALLGSDGKTVVQEFAPKFPKQYADMSFGKAPEGVNRDIVAGGALTYKIPVDALDLESDWTAPGFVPGPSWVSGKGFGAGHDVTFGGGDGGNLAPNGFASQSTSLFPPNLAIDGDLGTFTHTDSADNTSTWTLDLGREYDVAKVVLQNRRDCCLSRLRDVTVSLLGVDGATVRFRSSLLNPENSLDNPATLTVDLFELNVGTVAARYIRVERTPDPDLSGSNGQGNADEDNVLSLAEVEVYGAKVITYADLIRTDLAVPMRGKSATAALRVQFPTPSPLPTKPLRLQVRYDDGFVAWLNGTRIAEANAPDVLDGTAKAVTAHADEQALLFESWSVPAGLLAAGTNVLAIQGLNLKADDDDFLIDARLETDESAGPAFVYFNKATPGAVNSGVWYQGRLGEPKFSTKRGTYSQSFSLALTGADPGATIVYTLDGSEPSATRGAVYTGPISIAATTVVRARAIRQEYQSSDIETHTYLFPAAVARQPSAPAGFPARWANIGSDYAMDPTITAATAYSNRVEASLRALPSVSFSTEVDNLFGATRGIYANPENGGITWERPVSMEWINPDGTSEFQIDAGLRIQGGYFRSRNVTHKHSLRVVFKNEYGAGRLQHDLFGQVGAARDFDTLVLRAGANDGYAWDAARNTEQFIRDEFGRRLYGAMGQKTGHGRFVHVYLNGLYWGMYNLCERANEDFSATYYGGTPSEWDSVNAGDVKSGDLNAWNQFMQGVRRPMNLTLFNALQGLDPVGTRDPALPVYLDLENYLDYMLLNIWGGNWDWPNKNFWFGRRRTADSTGFKFYMWDFENTMGNNRDRSPLNAIAPRSDIASSWVGEPHFRLKTFSEYKLRFADHVQKQFFGAGPLSAQSLVERYRALADEVETAVIAETARWGDDHYRPPQTLVQWQAERDWLLKTYLPQRTAVVLGQLRAAGLYPALSAPVALPEGGSVSKDTPIVLKTPAKWLYYTLDGSDPRLVGGAPNPAARRVEFNSDSNGQPVDPILLPTEATWKYLDTGVDPGAGWFGVGYDDASCLSGKAELGYGDNDEATVVRFVDTDAATAGVQKNAATYFRTTFTVANPAAFESFNLEARYDDAVVVYLNGVELHRSDNLPSDAGFRTFATADRGDNSVAAAVHQRNDTSSDMSFALSLTGVPKAGNPQGEWNTTTPLTLQEPSTLRARSWNGTEWSPLMESRYSIDTVAPDASNLVVSEIAYRPPDASTPAEKQLTSDRDDFEFLELMNTAGQTLDLSGVTVMGGIQFQFAPGATLGAGRRLLLVRNRAAFQTRHGTQLPVAGEYVGRLGNSGDVLRLYSARGTLIREVSYGTQAPWPALTSGEGFSLTLLRPESNPNPNQSTSWRASVRPEGSPGTSDSIQFAGSPGVDADGNGRADLVDYALGDGSGLVAVLEPDLEQNLRLRIHLQRVLGADGAVVALETSGTADGPWVPIGETFEWVGSRLVRPGLGEFQYRALEKIDERDATFVRVIVRSAP